MKLINVSTKKYPNKFAIVDDEDFEWLNQWKWFISWNSYVKRNKPMKDGKTQGFIFMHRLVNNTPEGLFTDHINRNRLDNRKNNLRTVNKSQNGRNIDLQVNNKSGKTGVYWDKSRKKWVAIIKKDYKTKLLGRFNKINDAIAKREKAEHQFI